MAVHGVDSSPVLVSSPLHTEESAAGSRDFALAVANAAHPSQQAAAEALEFVGAVSVLAGDPARTGRVRDTTSDADRTCSCLTLGADCPHYETADPDTRRPDRGHRSPDIRSDTSAARA